MKLRGLYHVHMAIICIAFTACNNMLNGQFGSSSSLPSQSGAITFSGLSQGTNNNTLFDINGYNTLDISAFENGLSYPDNSNLVALWNLNENPSNGATISDSTSNNLNGQFNTTLPGTHGATGKFFGGVDFDGTNNQVQINTAAAANNLGPFSITAWIYSRSQGNGSFGTVLSKCSGTGFCSDTGQLTSGWTFGWTSAGTGRFTFGAAHGGGNLTVNSDQGTVHYDMWIQVAMTYDGTTNFTGVNFFRNGVLLNKVNGISGSGVRPDDSALDLLIGDCDGGGKFDGIIDSVTLWDRELTPAEINTIYTNQSRRIPGTYDSQIFDSEHLLTEWNSIEPETSHPMSKPLTTTSESEYIGGNFNATDLVAYWGLDGSLAAPPSTTSNALNGQGPLALTGTAVDTNSSLTYVDGMLNQGLTFDGTEDHIVLENSSALDITGTEITLMAWVKPASTCCSVGGSRIISKRTDGGGSDVYALILYDTGNFAMRVDGTDTSAPYQNYLDPETWRHVAGVYNGTDVRVYLDGELKGTPTPKVDTIDSSAQAVHIGMRQAEARHFVGAIDEVAIFNRALTATEIQDVYKRTAQKIKFQVRSCSEPTCTGINFIGPDGTSSTFYSDETRNASSTPSYNLINVPNNRYFQYRVFYEYGSFNDLTSVLRDVTVHATRP